MTQLEKAIALAREAHKGQLDKAGKPYFEHLERVAAGFQSADCKIVAYLHDILEDIKVTFEELSETFGSEIALHVLHLTRRKDEAYADFIYRVRCGGDVTMLVKCVDLSDNSDLTRLRIITKLDKERTEKYKLAMLYLEAFI